MTSQLYSRYIPPAKDTGEDLQNPKFKLPASDLQPPTPPTQIDASSTYARYVPSKSKSAVEANLPESTHSSPTPRKRERENNTEKVGEMPSNRLKVKKDKESKKDHKETEPKESDNGDKRVEKKYKSVIEKKEKSLKKAERLAKESIADEVEQEPETSEPVELHDLVPLPQPEPVVESILPAAESLPLWLASPIRISPKATKSFADLGLGEDVVKRLQKEGFDNAFAVQTAVLPLLLPGGFQQRGDILVSAATGSGKTLSYALPMIEDISRNRMTKLQGLVVLPTRELVHQAQKTCEICSAAFGAERGRKHVNIGTAVGNATLKAEQRALTEQSQSWDPAGYARQQALVNKEWERFARVVGEDVLPDHITHVTSKVDILICTPGRLVEHLKTLSLKDLKWLVVDEADKLMDQSYQQWLEVIKLPKHVRKIILSATMTRDIGQLSQLTLYRPKLVELGDSEKAHILPSTLLESAIKVDDESMKPMYLLQLLQTRNILPKDSSSPRVLIFTNSTESALRLSRLLALLSPSSTSLISTLSSTSRNLHGPILIGTDLASRGLDLDLEHVVNYDIPTSLTSYIHRVGRTARAGKQGHAWTLFTGGEGRWFWNEIARSNIVERGAVDRITLKIDAVEKEKYAEVLAELGKEAGR